MRREAPAPSKTPAKVDALRRLVAEAADERARLAAKLALARHFADAADGVNGLVVASEARTLALKRKDFAALAHALVSASISQYHRSAYVNAIAAAMDAYDCARRSGSRAELADSYAAIAISLLALGLGDMAMQVADKGLAHASSDELLGTRVRLIRLKGLLCHMRGHADEADEFFAESVALSRHSTREQLAACHGNWGIALVRDSERLLREEKSATHKLNQAREHFEIALRIAEEDGDTLVATDRIGSLGAVAFLQGESADAERLLSDAMERGHALDFVHMAVVAALYLGRLHLQQGDAKKAAGVLRHAVAQARRGAAEDVLVMAQMLLADAFEQSGETARAASERSQAEQHRVEAEGHRLAAAADARKLARRVLLE